MSSLPWVAAVLGACFSLALLRAGIVLGPDSWAYWEGSVSLLERHAYAYFGGAPITAFPPLFSIVLALAQAALGVSARTLAIVLVLLSAAGSYAWAVVYLVVRGTRRRSPLDALAVLYLPAVLAVSAQVLLSEALWLVLLPVLLALLVAPPSPSRRREALRPLAVWVLLVGLLLTRNVTLALLPGVALLYAWRGGSVPLRRRLLTALGLLVASVVPWLVVRRVLGQLAAHALGSGQRGVFAYAREATSGLAHALGPERHEIGAVLLCGAAVLIAVAGFQRFRFDESDARPATRLLAFAGLALAGHVVLFGATYVAEPLAGRFLIFAALLLTLWVMATATCFARTWQRQLGTLLATFLTLVACYRVAVKYRLAGIEQATTPLDVTISSSYWTGPERQLGGLRLVAPPGYAWVQRPGSTAPFRENAGR